MTANTRQATPAGGEADVLPGVKNVLAVASNYCFRRTPNNISGCLHTPGTH